MKIGLRKLISPMSVLVIGFIFLVGAFGFLYIKVNELTKTSKSVEAYEPGSIMATPFPTPSIESRRSEIIFIINLIREQTGLLPLKENILLNKSAQLKAQDMLDKGYWAHNSPAGTEPWVFFSKVGYEYSMAGENLGRDFILASGVVDGWMNSPKHREILLDPRYQEVGVGIVDVTEGTSEYVSGSQISIAHFGSQR
jgi:uncharacterized protein YkwD